jgi:hypothetical protein
VSQFGADPVHVVRFYLPALGLIALLGAWTVVHIPRGAVLAAVAVLLVLGVLSFNSMAADAAPGSGPGRAPTAGAAGAPGRRAGPGTGHGPKGGAHGKPPDGAAPGGGAGPPGAGGA